MEREEGQNIMHWIYAHLIGDYLIQTDVMAQNKKRCGAVGLWSCLSHVATYMIPFIIFCELAWWQLVLIAVQHYVIDRSHFVEWFMDWKGSSMFSKGVCFPWSQIAVDNILHILWMAFVVWIPSSGLLDFLFNFF